MSLLNLGVLQSLLPRQTLEDVQETMRVLAARALESEERLKRVEQLLLDLSTTKTEDQNDGQENG